VALLAKKNYAGDRKLQFYDTWMLKISILPLNSQNMRFSNPNFVFFGRNFSDRLKFKVENCSVPPATI